MTKYLNELVLSFGGQSYVGEITDAHNFDIGEEEVHGDFNVRFDPHFNATIAHALSEQPLSREVYIAVTLNGRRVMSDDCLLTRNPPKPMNSLSRGLVAREQDSAGNACVRIAFRRKIRPYERVQPFEYRKDFAGNIRPAEPAPAS